MSTTTPTVTKPKSTILPWEVTLQLHIRNRTDAFYRNEITVSSSETGGFLSWVNGNASVEEQMEDVRKLGVHLLLDFWEGHPVFLHWDVNATSYEEDYVNAVKIEWVEVNVDKECEEKFLPLKLALLSL
jgi:hypothetical protein